eukprot:380718_1
MLEFISGVVSGCTSSCVASLIGGAVLLYLIFGWLFKPTLKDSYFEVDETYFYELKYVGKHSKKISLQDIPKCIEEMKGVYRSNFTRKLANRRKELNKLMKLLKENEEE